MLLLAMLVVMASLNNSVETADNAVYGIHDVVGLGADELDDYSSDFDVFLQEESSPEEATITVPVSPGQAEAPQPTIETLMPKHTKLVTEKFKTANGGKEPDELENVEIKRLAVKDAAAEINEAQQHRDAIEVAKMKEQRLIRKIKRDKDTIGKVSQNEEYAARKAYESADRKVKYLESKANKREYEAEEEMQVLNKEKMDMESAYKKRIKAKQDVIRGKELQVAEQKKVDDAMDAVMKAETIQAKAKSTIEESKDEVIKKTDFLDNIEAHEADARLQYRQAKIQKEFEEGDARKVKVLLKRLTAKKKAIFKFTRSLDQKSQRDFRAAEAGIEKAKSDYAEAKGEYDKFTRKAGEYEKKLLDTQKNIEMAKKGVVMGVNTGRDSMAIKSAENYGSLKKTEAKDKTKVDTEDINAKGQNKMMGAAMAELAKSEALETVARKQKDMVKQHRITMTMQVEKIDFLKAEVKKHLEKAAEADKKAKSAMKKVRTMRKNAIRARDEAKSRERYAQHIDVPMSGRAAKKAHEILERDKFTEKEETDNIMTLKREAREYYLQARTLKKQRDDTQEKVKKAVERAGYAKKMMQKSETKRDATLAHNKQKMAAINERLNKAEEHFKKATTPVEPAPAAAPAAAPASREEMDDEEELGDARGRHERDYEETPRHERRGRARDDERYEEPRRERSEPPRRHRYDGENRMVHGRAYQRRGRFLRGRPRFHQSLGESRHSHRFGREGRAPREEDRYSADTLLHKHPLELPSLEH